MQLRMSFHTIGEKVLLSQNKPSHLAAPFPFLWRTTSSFPSPSVLQLLPQGLLLWPGLLRQHAGGEHSGEGSQDEIGRDPLAIVHSALPLHELPGASGQVRWVFFSTFPWCLVKKRCLFCILLPVVKVWPMSAVEILGLCKHCSRSWCRYKRHKILKCKYCRILYFNLWSITFRIGPIEAH